MDKAMALCEKKAYRELIAELQLQVRRVREEYKEETKGREEFKRSMMELAKYGQTEPTVVLRTTREKKSAATSKQASVKKKRKTGK